MFGGFTVRPADSPKDRMLIITFYEYTMPIVHSHENSETKLDKAEKILAN